MQGKNLSFKKVFPLHKQYKLLSLKSLEVRANERNILLNGTSPLYSILDYKLNVLILEGPVSLMAGLEIEYSSVSASPSTTAAEHLSAVEPTHKNNIVGIGNIKALAVHLLGLENEGLVNACGDGMIRHYRPNSFTGVISPLKIAGSTHKSAEYL